MKLLLIISALFLFSCNPYKKIASDVKRTDAETKLLATICAAEFPPVEYISEGTTVVDSTAYKEAYKALEHALQDAGTDVQNLIDLIEQKGQDNEVLKEMLFAAQKKVDSLNAVKQAYKYIPCPETHTRDTSHLINKAELTALQIKYDQLNREKAEKDVEIAALTTDNEIKSNQIKNNRADKLKVGGIMLAVGIFLSIVAGLFLKLKKLL